MIFDQLFRPTIEKPPCFRDSGFDRADAVDSLSYFHHDSPKNNWRWWWWRGGLLHNVINLINVSHSLMSSLKLFTRQVSVKWQLMQRRTVSFYSGLVRNWGLLSIGLTTSADVQEYPMGLGPVKNWAYRSPM